METKTKRPPCDHQSFEASVTVVRLEDVGRFTADIHVRCADCGVRFRWLGCDRGSHPGMPMVSVDEFELRAPLVPDAHLTSLMAGPDTGFPHPAARSSRSEEEDQWLKH